MTWRDEWQREQYRYERRQLRAEMLMTGLRAAVLIIVWAIIIGCALGLMWGIAISVMRAMTGAA